MAISKYSKEVIKKAIRMRKKGYDGRAIMIELGFTHIQDVYYHTNPKRKEYIKNYAREWYNKNK